jgi:hypothetical protein
MTGWRKTAALGIAFIGIAAALWWISRGDARQADSDFRWFETLGFPDAKDLPYVRVATGGWSQADDESPQNTYLHGSLLSTNKDAFKVLLLDLSVRWFTNSPSTKQEYERVGFDLLDLKREAAGRLKELRQSETRVLADKCPKKQRFLSLRRPAGGTGFVRRRCLSIGRRTNYPEPFLPITAK